MDIADTSPCFQLFDMVCTRICHDLAGQVCSVGNGMSLLSNSMDDRAFRDEALGLITLSTSTMETRLSFFRAMCGRPGPLNNEREMSALAVAYLSTLRSGRYAVSANISGKSSDLHILKSSLALCLIGGDMLIKGGTVSLMLEDSRLECVFSGDTLAVTQETMAALNGDVDRLNPKTCFYAYLHYMAKSGGFSVKSDVSNRNISIFINK